MVEGRRREGSCDCGRKDHDRHSRTEQYVLDTRIGGIQDTVREVPRVSLQLDCWRMFAELDQILTAFAKLHLIDTVEKGGRGEPWVGSEENFLSERGLGGVPATSGPMQSSLRRKVLLPGYETTRVPTSLLVLVPVHTVPDTSRFWGVDPVAIQLE